MRRVWFLLAVILAMSVFLSAQDRKPAPVPARPTPASNTSIPGDQKLIDYLLVAAQQFLSLRADADLVFSGTVLKVSSVSSEKKENSWIEIWYKVSRCYKGCDEINTSDGVRIYVPGVPSPDRLDSTWLVTASRTTVPEPFRGVLPLPNTDHVFIWKDEWSTSEISQIFLDAAFSQ